MRIVSSIAVVIALSVLAPGNLFAEIGYFERYFGVTNINGIVGNGGLSAGYSQNGELTVLKWPSPSFYEHLNYKTSREDNARQLPYFGAAENMGSFAGIIYRTHGSANAATSWLREDAWVRTQEYADEDTPVLLTRAEHSGLGISVAQYSFVLPEMDVLLNHYAAERKDGSPVSEMKLLYYANLSPCLKKVEMFPLSCWTDDDQNDFAALYSSRHDALIHFLPESKSYAPFEELFQESLSPSQESIDGLIDELDDRFGDGIYIATGGSPASTEHQCGFDSMTPCADPWESRPEDAFTDAQDGALSGSSIAVCQANTAMAVPMGFDGRDRAEATVIVAFSSTAGGALSMLEQARGVSAAGHIQETSRWWKEWIGQAVLPRSDDAGLRIFSKRALVTLKIYTDRKTGATVDSIQPPWQVWPLDAADHAFALDLAGYHEMAERENLFLAEVQRKKEGASDFGPFPAGSFAEAYYADGAVAAPIPFIISWTSRVVRAWWAHAKFIKDPGERELYLKAVYPSIRLAAETLSACKDENTGLHCPASCSESFEKTQDLWDAAGAHLALISAVEAGRHMKEDESRMGIWEQRAKDLREAILGSENPGDAPCDYWWLWPQEVVSYDAPAMEAPAQILWEKLAAGLNMEQGVRGIFYHGWYMTTLARSWLNDNGKMQQLKEAIRIYTGKVPTPGTHHLGDDFLVVPDEEGGSSCINVTSTPNSFSSTNIYIAAMAVHDPRLFDSLEEPLPDGEPAEGCGCRALEGPRGSVPRHVSSGILVLMFALFLLSGKRWRH